MIAIESARQLLIEYKNHLSPKTVQCITDLIAEVERLEGRLNEAADYLNGLEVCCCGDPIANHGYTDSHGPVSMLDHHVECRIKERTSKLRQRAEAAEAQVKELELIVSGKTFCDERREAAEQCIAICQRYFGDNACTGDYAAQHIAEAIRSEVEALTVGRGGKDGY